MNLKKYQTEVLIGCVSLLLFVPFLGNVHLFDWDEINFAECAREMLVTGEYGRVYLNFLPFWEKPPFFFWLQALGMQVFGVSEFSARLPNALCGTATLLVLYRVGLKLHGPVFGLIWAGVFAGSVLPHFYFHSGLIDPWFNMFIFSALVVFIEGSHPHQSAQIKGSQDQRRFPYFLFSGLLLGLALITKGPVSILVFGLTILIYWAYVRFKVFFSVYQIAGMALGVLGIAGLWVGLEVLKNGTWFFEEFIRYSYRLFSTPDAGHGGFPGYHVVVLLFGCFPASFFFIHGHIFPPEMSQRQKTFRLFMLILFWVVLILFSLVKSKIVHYSSLCYFPLSYVAAQAVHHFWVSGHKVPILIRISVFFVGLMVGLTCLFFPYISSQAHLLRPLFAKDPFAQANLDAVVKWAGWEALVGVFIFSFTGLCLYFFQRSRTKQAFISLFGGSTLMVIFILWAFIGRIESFSQGAMIDFYKSLAEEDCYVIPYNHKSYAPYFYARVKPENSPKIQQLQNLGEELNHWRDSLLTCPVLSKPVYVVTKINRKEGLEQYPKLKLLYEKNGWSFFVRKNQAKKEGIF